MKDLVGEPERMEYGSTSYAYPTIAMSETFAGAFPVQCAYETDLWGFMTSSMIKNLSNSRDVVKGCGFRHSMHGTQPLRNQILEHYGKPELRHGSTKRCSTGLIACTLFTQIQPETLKNRIWGNTIAVGLLPILFVLRNKKRGSICISFGIGQAW